MYVNKLPLQGSFARQLEHDVTVLGMELVSHESEMEEIVRKTGARREARACATQRNAIQQRDQSAAASAQVRTRRRSGARWLLRPPRPPRRTARRRVC